MKQRFAELVEEFRTVMSARAQALDAMAPPLVFTVANAVFGLKIAAVVALAIALGVMIVRIARAQGWAYAAAGFLMTAFAAGSAWLARSSSVFFLPGIVSGAVLFAAALVSIIVKRPLAALSSHLTRGWHLDWYALDTVRPAYAEVTGAWTALIAGRLAVLVGLLLRGDEAALGWTAIALGWPAIVIVLAASYLYGIARLRSLGGPSVDEYRSHAEPPWTGQRRGF